MSGERVDVLVWSVDGEAYSHESLDEALEELDGMDELAVGRTLYCGTPVKPNPRSFITADDVIDTIANRAWDEVGEHADDFPNVTDEAKAELSAFLEAWLEKNCQPTFWLVENSSGYSVTAEDVSRIQPDGQGE